MTATTFSNPATPTIRIVPPELEERIRQRAYELYEARGKEDGHERDDWLQAESEVSGRKRMAVAT